MLYGMLRLCPPDWLPVLRITASLDVAPASVVRCGLMSEVEMFGRETPGSLSTWFQGSPQFTVSMGTFLCLLLGVMLVCTKLTKSVLHTFPI